MNSGSTIRNGSTGDDVRRLQRILVMTKSLGYTEIDGVFGAKTETAVKDFQSGSGLTADGIVGPNTWHALPADPNTPQVGPGSHGPVVTALQKGLRKYGGEGADTDPRDGAR